MSLARPPPPIREFRSGLYVVDIGFHPGQLSALLSPHESGRRRCSILTDATLALLPGITAEVPAAKRNTLQEQPEMSSALAKASRAPRGWSMRTLLPLVLIGGTYWYTMDGSGDVD